MPAAGPRLQAFLQAWRDDPALAGLADDDAPLAAYEAVLPLLESRMWQAGAPDGLVAEYQALHREMEEAIAMRGDDRRHDFVVVVPVADRPGHLALCLESLFEQCRAFHYGGLRDGRFDRVRAIIADDSREPGNRARHAELARRFTADGLQVIHFDHPEQRAELRGLGGRLDGVAAIVGDDAEADFARKGPSRMRNIAYLALRRLAKGARPTLFLFLDSDQEFRVLACGGGRHEPMALSHFHALDRLFRERPITLLTGKVVGDPPVSPAVMAGNFLADVAAFLARMRELGPDGACRFHGDDGRRGGDAAYHDMADLFGLAPEAGAHDYLCDLRGEHDHRACLARFAERLGHFFDGEHPTRISCHRHQPLDETVVPARTIYTGNYVMNLAGLRYFIPFAGLRLRMAGPTLGRIARAELGGGFVSANLPLLHKRTLASAGRSEFRPGVERRDQRVDLGGEFERQFFGDVMLFSVESLCDEGYPGQLPERTEIAARVEVTARRLREQYRSKRQQIVHRLARARAAFSVDDAWWRNAPPATAEAFAAFFANIEANFGDDARGYRLIDDEAHRARRLAAIVDAIAAYPRDRAAWEAALDLPPPR